MFMVVQYTCDPDLIFRQRQGLHLKAWLSLASSLSSAANWYPVRELRCGAAVVTADVSSGRLSMTRLRLPMRASSCSCITRHHVQQDQIRAKVKYW